MLKTIKMFALFMIALIQAQNIDINNIYWETTVNKNYCQISQNIPGSGEIHIIKEAGDKIWLDLIMHKPIYNIDKIGFIAHKPEWRHDIVYLKGIEFFKPKFRTEDTIRLPEKFSYQAIELLESGLGFSIYIDNNKYTFLPVKFKDPIKKFEKCLSKIFTQNYYSNPKVFVQFDFNSTQIRYDDVISLTDLAYFLLQCPEKYSIEIIGYTDSIGTQAFNHKLSGIRAQRVKDFLTNLQIPTDNITIKAGGERNPIATNKNANGRNKNRRVEVSIKYLR